ncbi:hypothetical protein D3C72_1864310 [compost metagenome]
MDHYSKENFPLTQSVGSLLNRARNTVLMEMDAALKDLDITSHRWGSCSRSRRELLPPRSS